jgi:hypothetical protein
MYTLHRVRPAEFLAALDRQNHNSADSFLYDLTVAGSWTGEGQIDFAAFHGSSTGPFPDILSFWFTAKSRLGTAEFAAIDLAFAYWSMGPSGQLTSFSILTNQVEGMALSIQLGENGAKLQGKRFATLDTGTLGHAMAETSAVPDLSDPARLWPGGPMLRSI